MYRAFLVALLEDIKTSPERVLQLSASSPPARLDSHLNKESPKTEKAPMNTRDVFVIHGRDERLRAGMFDFLKSLDLHPMEWEYAVQLTGEATPYVGQVLDAAFSHAQAVVVLFTPDDVAKLRPDLCGKQEPEHETALTPQARPNVLFEAGMAMARNAERTILVEIGALRPFSDAGGRHTIRMNNSVEKRKALALRLQSAGCTVNLNGDWEHSGDLSAPERWADPGKNQLLSAVGTIAKLEEENRQLRIAIAQRSQKPLEPQPEVRQVGAVNYAITPSGLERRCS
jgi:predicted nucleotide-binding protein